MTLLLTSQHFYSKTESVGILCIVVHAMQGVPNQNRSNCYRVALYSQSTHTHMVALALNDISAKLPPAQMANVRSLMKAGRATTKANISADPLTALVTSLVPNKTQMHQLCGGKSRHALEGVVRNALDFVIESDHLLEDALSVERLSADADTSETALLARARRRAAEGITMSIELKRAARVDSEF